MQSNTIPPTSEREHEHEHERELPMLAGVAAVLRWCEELLNLLNGPILLFGAGIALTDLLTDGALTTSVSALLFAWALSQALGIDTQLLGCFARARSVSGWRRAGWLVLGLILCVAAWQAGYVYAVQQSAHITEAAALAELHLPRALWLGERAALAVGLVALSGWTRYRAPAPPPAADVLLTLESELALAPLRAELRRRQAAGLRGVGEALLKGATPTATDSATGADAGDLPPEPPDPPNGRHHDAQTDAAPDSEMGHSPYGPPLRMIAGRRAGVQAHARKVSRDTALRTQAFALLDAHPGMTKSDLRAALRVRRETASALYAAWQYNGDHGKRVAR